MMRMSQVRIDFELFEEKTKRLFSFGLSCWLQTEEYMIVCMDELMDWVMMQQ